MVSCVLTAQHRIMDLNVLDHRLKIASIRKQEIARCMHELVRIGMLGNSECRFFTLTETCDNYTLVIDKNIFTDVIQNVAEHTALGTWVPLSVSAGAYSSVKVSGISNIAKSLIIPLADAQISVFCLSSYQTDYILVEESDIEKAIQALSTKSDFVKVDTATTVPLDKRDLQELLPGHTQHRPITHAFSEPKNKFHITSLDKDNLHLAGLALIEQLFYPKCFGTTHCEKEHFFSYSNVDGDITLVLDSDAVSRFPENSIYTAEGSWRMIKIGGSHDDLGFSEYGIVAQVSSPIADANIEEYYLSSFFAGYTMVPESSLEEVITLLNSRLCLSGEPPAECQTHGPPT